MTVAHLEIQAVLAHLDLLVYKVARKVRKENLVSLERGENLEKMVTQATLDIRVIKEIRVVLVYLGEMVTMVRKVIEDFLDLQDMGAGHSMAKDQKGNVVILDHLVLKETEDLQVLKDHLVHQDYQEQEVQDHLVHQVYLEREERREMKASLEPLFLERLEGQGSQVPKDSKDLLVPQEYIMVICHVCPVLLVNKACRESVDILENQDKKVKKERRV